MNQKDQTKPTTKNQRPTTSYVAHGRRKEAVARVKLFKGKGETVVNDKPVEKYFSGKVANVMWQKPLILTKTLGQYFAKIKVKGSGKSGQLDATVHGLSRALILVNSDFRPILKKAGLLTRDPRVKERRKYGLAQKARKGKQSPKR
jgi:small subunit ribosomal protein S9